VNIIFKSGPVLRVYKIIFRMQQDMLYDNCNTNLKNNT